MDKIIKSRKEINSSVKRIHNFFKQMDQHDDSDPVSLAALAMDNAYATYWNATCHITLLNKVADEFGMTDKLKVELEETENMRDNLKAICMSMLHSLDSAVKTVGKK